MFLEQVLDLHFLNYFEESLKFKIDFFKISIILE